MTRTTSLGCHGRDVAECMLLALAGYGPGYDWCPSTSDDEVRRDIVVLLRKKTGLAISHEDPSIEAVFTRVRVKLVRYKVFSTRRVLQLGADQYRPVYWITDTVLVQKLRPELYGPVAKSKGAENELLHSLRLAYPLSTKY